jgi:hypothetical protein
MMKSKQPKNCSRLKTEKTASAGFFESKKTINYYRQQDHYAFLANNHPII